MFALSLVVELVLLLILCLGVYFGARRGFVRIATGPIKLLLSVIAAYNLCDVVAGLCLVPAMQIPITNILVRYLGDGITDAIGERIVYSASLILSFAVIYFLSRALISVVLSISDTVLSSGLIGYANKGVGALLGFLIALIWAWLVAAGVDIAFETGALNGLGGAVDAPAGVLYRTLRGGGYIDAWRDIQLINFR